MDVDATALPDDRADLVVIEGATAALTGFVVVRERNRLEVLAARPAADTRIHLPPMDGVGVDVVVFGGGGAPLRLAPIWTPGVDTVRARINPPIPVDLEFDVRSGAFGAQRERMLLQLDALQEIWSTEAAGVTLGSVVFHDRTEAGREIHLSSRDLCAGRTVGATVRVTVVTTIDDGGFTGWGCWSGDVFLADGADRTPRLLAHELGHTFTLAHTSEGLMDPNNPGGDMSEGEIYRMHFNEESVLNTIFRAQPEEQRRLCHVTTPFRLCLPEELDLRTLAGSASLRPVVARPSAPR